MAAQLSPKKLSGMFESGEKMHIPARVLTAACVAVTVAAVAAVVAGIWTAQRDEQAALRRFDDAQALLALPVVDTSALQAELAASKNAVATAQALAAPPSVDPSSDASTALLVRRATEAGLKVGGVASVAPGMSKNGEIAYDVEGVRMTVDGSVDQITRFLGALRLEEPGLVPALNTMTISDTNVARAEIIFNFYSVIVPPTPVAPRAGGAR